MTVNVVLPLPLDQAYTYRVPEALVGAAQAGARVLVPFRNRRLTGIIVGEGPAAETLDFDVKAVLDVLDDVPVCTEGLLDLTKWIADYYVCPWGEALKAVLPAGTTVETEHRLTRTDAAPDAWADHEVGRTVLEDLAAHGETTLAAVRKRVGPAVPLALIRRMAADDVVAVETTLSDERVAPKTETHLRFAPAFTHTAAPERPRPPHPPTNPHALRRARGGSLDAAAPRPHTAAAVQN